MSAAQHTPTDRELYKKKCCSGQVTVTLVVALGRMAHLRSASRNFSVFLVASSVVIGAWFASRIAEKKSETRHSREPFLPEFAQG